MAISFIPELSFERNTRIKSASYLYRYSLLNYWTLFLRYVADESISLVWLMLSDRWNSIVPFWVTSFTSRTFQQMENICYNEMAFSKNKLFNFLYQSIDRLIESSWLCSVNTVLRVLKVPHGTQNPLYILFELHRKSYHLHTAPFSQRRTMPHYTFNMYVENCNR